MGRRGATAGEELDETGLLARRKPIGLDRLPPEVLYLTAGVDVQKDRLESTTLGWQADGTAAVLEHAVIWGDPLENDIWVELDDLLKRDFRHPHGGALRYDCAFVDAGDGNMQAHIFGFCWPRTARRIFAIKGQPGFSRPFAEKSRGKRGLFFTVGVDALKSRLFNQLHAGTGWRFSDSLPAHWFEQLTAERRVVKHTRGQPVVRFERITGRRAEALDTTVYAMAARSLVGVPVEIREAEVASKSVAPRPPAVIKSKWLDGDG